MPYFVSLKYIKKIIIKEYNTFVFNDIGIYMAEVLKAERYYNTDNIAEKW